MDVRVYMRLSPKKNQKANLLYFWLDKECCLDEIDTIVRALHPLCVFLTMEEDACQRLEYSYDVDV